MKAREKDSRRQERFRRKTWHWCYEKKTTLVRLHIQILWELDSAIYFEFSLRSTFRL